MVVQTTTEGAYQEISVSDFQKLKSSEVSKYSKVVKISDILPGEAGGDGTDYLMNIEEVSFEGDHVTLVVDSWGHGNEHPMQVNYMWKPAGNAQKVNQSPVNQIEAGGQFGGGGRTPHGGQSYDIYTYTENADGTGAAVKRQMGKLFMLGMTNKFYDQGTETTQFL